MADDIYLYIININDQGMIGSAETLQFITLFPKTWEPFKGVSIQDLKRFCVSPSLKRDGSSTWILEFVIFTEDGGVDRWRVDGTFGFTIKCVKREQILPPGTFKFQWVQPIAKSAVETR